MIQPSLSCDYNRFDRCCYLERARSTTHSSFIAVAMGLLGCAKRPRESDMSDEWTTVARPGLMRASDWFTLVTEGQRKVEICMKYVISCAEKKSMKSSSREHVKKEAERTRGSASKKVHLSTSSV